MISWSEEGMSDNPMCIASLSNPDPIDFVLGTGHQQSVDNQLCGQILYNGWDVRGVFQNKKTKFVRRTHPMMSGFITAHAVLQQPGAAGCSTTFKAKTFSAGPVAAKIKTGGTKDKLYVTSVAGDRNGAASVGETIKVTDGSGTPVEIDLGAGSENGGSVKLDHTGLYLYASSDGTQLASFSGTIYSYGSVMMDWSVDFDGQNLDPFGIDPRDFVPIAGGYFLPRQYLPGGDFSIMVSGDIQVSINNDANIRSHHLNPGLVPAIRGGDRAR